MGSASPDRAALLAPTKEPGAISCQRVARLKFGSELVGGHQHHLDLHLESTKPSDWTKILNNQRRRALSRCSAFSARIAAGAWKQRTSPTRDKEKSPDKNDIDDDQGDAVIGIGAFGTVRIVRRMRPDSAVKEQLAVKQFHQRPGHSSDKYRKEVLAEFSIANALEHHNIVSTFELFEDKQNNLYQVMEFCAGGDLQTLLLSEHVLDPREADCFFKQLMRGVEYLHSMGVAHCDLKPGNILLTKQGVIKITDFGCSECFRLAWEDDLHMVTGRRGSTPFIAPEEYTEASFDGRAVDVWACGVIFVLMRTGELLWEVAKQQDDADYTSYIRDRRLEAGFEQIEALEPEDCRLIMYSILDPVAPRRITAVQVMRSRWLRSIELCAAACLPST